MKRAYRSRKDCGAALLTELQRKFPEVEFKLTYFDDSKWSFPEAEQYWIKYSTSPALLRESAEVCWTDGPGVPVIGKIAEKYLRNSWLFHEDRGLFQQVKNVGWDEQGNAVQMGLFHNIFTGRELTDEGRERAAAILAAADSEFFSHCEPEDVSL